MADASLLEALSGLAAMDPVSFGHLTSPSGWSDLRDSRLYPLYKRAMETRSKVEGADSQLAKLQHLFAANVVEPKALKRSP